MMHTQLKERLWAYIVENNPDLMFRLQDEYRVTRYLEEKVAETMPIAGDLVASGTDIPSILELCLRDMTAHLRPSRYNYVTSVLAEEFGETHAVLRESGTLTYEAVNLVEHCRETFDLLLFSEDNEGDSKIYYAIAGRIAEYLENRRQLERA